MEYWALAGFTELKRLGKGAFGWVVLARHDASGQLVAIKYLSGSGDHAQFRHEAAVLRQVVSPHVTRLYEFVEDPRGAAIVMEAVPGVALKAILDREPVLPPEAALAILKGSLLGLAAAHAAHIVHRDYKPGNVLVQPNHQSKLVDFGIALASGHSGQSSGTPAYMAPEQWRGGPATPATDVYAATCVFFLCVTGMRPYRGDDLRPQHEYAPVPVEAVAEPLRGLVASGMAKDPAARPASAATFVAQLEAAATAGYGPDWESRGWQRLAWHAGTLLALSPLAFLASAAGVLAPAAGTAVAGGAAGAAGTGLFASVAAKVAAVVVGVGVAAGATVVIVNSVGDDPPGASQEALQVDVRNRAETFDTFSIDAQYAEVSGLADPAVQERVNATLREPVDGWVEFLQDRTQNPPPDVAPATGTVEARVRISGPKVLSVDYVRVAGDTGYFFGAGGTVSIVPVTIDLDTGQVLELADIFPDVTTDEGAAALGERVAAAHPDGICGDSGVTGSVPLEFTAESFTDPYSNGDDPIAQVVFTREGAEFAIYASAFGYPNACNFSTAPVPYADLTDLMSPRAVELLTR